MYNKIRGGNIFKLYTDDILICNLIEKCNIKYDLVDSSYEPKEGDILCFYINRVSKEEFNYKLEKYKNYLLILIFDRRVAFHFFDTINAPNASYLLVDEMSKQFKLCYETTVKSGMYISVFFRQLITVKNKYNGLSNRDLDVIDLLKDGYSYKEIASVTKLKYGTIRNYISRILAITDSDNKTELALHFQDIIRDSDEY